VNSDIHRGENRIYIVISIFVFIVIILTILFANNNLIPAYIDDDVLEENNWSENISERFYIERLFGLEKQASFTYQVNNDTYHAYVTVTTLKTLFMMSEQNLLQKTIETIENAARNQGLLLDNISKVSGQRRINISHRTMYVVFNGTNISDGEKIKIIGETWNCASSGTSIICIGFAQVTDFSHNKTGENLVNWATILKDETGTFTKLYNDNIIFKGNGLIYNVRCH